MALRLPRLMHCDPEEEIPSGDAPVRMPAQRESRESRGSGVTV